VVLYTSTLWVRCMTVMSNSFSKPTNEGVDSGTIRTGMTSLTIADVILGILKGLL
jgi:hypothetical protein